VAVLAVPLLDEHLEPAQWLGSLIGVAGVAFAVAEQLNGGGSSLGFVFALIGLAGLVGGTLVQRAHGSDVDPKAANTIQLAVAALVITPLAGFTQGFSLSAASLPPLAWLIFGLSIGAVMLFFWLLRNEKSGDATSFLYLVPATTAIALCTTWKADPGICLSWLRLSSGQRRSEVPEMNQLEPLSATISP
jgi:drug/metabolite transporter (DMT)-like permease